MNVARLEKSLRLLRELNVARALHNKGLITKYEMLLKQHDYDAKDKVDPRQLSIFDVPPK